ncbi:uncharacterized protein LOC106656138 isoform X1 [Trichogramma pretiosum]|uniref:uncharacterized protein LOC106656138 isoform X1 n=1 Tax=Trichogramma pretiosum TaxID=7493 RepID=UPI000C71911A|nr:uncharacterized protein LOC106656138 isoform X1 [Trichogramma pretiosum]
MSTRISWECDNATKSTAEESLQGGPAKPFPCAPDKFCFYCCCNPQCCFVIQRKPPKHFWEAWYVWLSIALLLVIVLSAVNEIHLYTRYIGRIEPRTKLLYSIGTYIVTNCKQNLASIGFYGRGIGAAAAATTTSLVGSAASRNRALQQQQAIVDNRNEISINVIPTSAATLSSHRKIMLIPPQPACTHLTPIVA